MKTNDSDVTQRINDKEPIDVLEVNNSNMNNVLRCQHATSEQMSDG